MKQNQSTHNISVSAMPDGGRIVAAASLLLPRARDWRILAVSVLGMCCMSPAVFAQQGTESAASGAIAAEVPSAANLSLESPFVLQDTQQPVTLQDETPLSRSSQVLGFAKGVSDNIVEWFRFGSEEEQGQVEPDTSSVTLDPDLMLEAFPVLVGMEDTLSLLDASHEHTVLDFDFVPGQPSSGVDVSASYVWESPRFGQFILSANTTYPSQQRNRENTVLTLGDSASAFGAIPEKQSSFTFTWQIGKHTATAVTSYADAMENLNTLTTNRINIEQLDELMGQIATLDLRYGYQVNTGRQGNASFSVGIRNQFDRRWQPINLNRLNEPSRVAYGTIKYQF